MGTPAEGLVAAELLGDLHELRPDDPTSARVAGAVMSLLTASQRITLAPLTVTPAPADSTGSDLIVRQPVPLNLIAYAGDDLNFELAVYSPVDGSPLDLTGGEICCQARTTPPDWLVLGNLETLIYDTNVIAIVLRAWLTAKLPVSAVWDCELLLQGITTTLAAGSITTVTDVSRCRQTP